MYTVAVKRDFIAQHYLVGGDWGAENFPHSHHYVLELQIEHAQLDQHGYLVDIVDIESALDRLVDYVRDKQLNDLPEFEGLNPSLEHFSRIISRRLLNDLSPPSPGKLRVKLWENESCWAAYQLDY